MRLEQTKLKRKGADIEEGEDDGKKPSSKRGTGGRGRGKGRGRGRGRQTPQASTVEPEWDEDDYWNEWQLFQEERAATRKATRAVAKLEEAVYAEAGKPAENNQPKKRKASKPEKKEEDAGNEEEADSPKAEIKEKSFARRPAPKTDGKYQEWNAIRTAFDDKIAMFVDYPGKFQDCFACSLLSRAVPVC